VQAPWEAGVALPSIAVDEVYFWCLVAGGLVLGVWVLSRKCQWLPSLLEGSEFWPAAMVEEKGQPMEIKEFGFKWERVETKEGKGKVVEGNQLSGSRAQGEAMGGELGPGVS